MAEKVAKIAKRDYKIDLPEESELHILTKFKPEFAEVAARLVAAGFTEHDLGYTFGVSQKTIQDWKVKYPAFKEACKDGREMVRKRLVAAAIQQAIGYEFHDKNVKTRPNGAVESSEFIKHQTGNANLLMWILCNLARQDGDYEWQAAKNTEVAENKTLNVTIDGKVASDQISRLAGKLLEGNESEGKFE